MLAYDPFTPRPREGFASTLEFNELQMRNDFPDDPTVRMFQVKKHFAVIELKFVTDCKWNRVKETLQHAHKHTLRKPRDSLNATC